MKYIICIISLLIALSTSGKAFAQVNIFACEPEWAALAKEIGGEYVSVTTATTAAQDVHFIRAKPSLLAAMRKADLVFCTGASLEIGWLPILIKKAGGPDVQQETIGWLMASDHVKKLGVPTQVDRSMGHVHPEGNPHVHLDPRHLIRIAEILEERLFLLDRDNQAYYAKNLSLFKSQWSSLLGMLDESAAPLKGQKVIVYHDGWAYLLNWLGLESVAALEPKPGLPPTPSHLESVLETVRGQDILGILVAPYENDKSAIWLKEKTGIPVLNLPYTVGGNNSVNTLSDLYSQSINILKGAL
ncbi:MAG: zinc ABC transporter substrate-binding protein [Alphaproteobacteria bacterium]|nr:zinc ABC transporter substrate-binding protein [Alphaproteobacteria bacterium]